MTFITSTGTLTARTINTGLLTLFVLYGPFTDGTDSTTFDGTENDDFTVLIVDPADPDINNIQLLKSDFTLGTGEGIFYYELTTPINLSPLGSIPNVQYKIFMTRTTNGGNAYLGGAGPENKFLSDNGTTPAFDILTEEVTPTTVDISIVSNVQPINTYLAISRPQGITFNYSSGSTYIAFNSTDIGLTLALKNNTNNTSTIVPLTYGLLTGYTGTTPSNLVSGTTYSLNVIYQGETFSSGNSFQFTPPSLTLESPVINADYGNPGALILTFPGGTYTYTNFPDGVSISTDGGNLVYTDISGVTYVSGGLVVDTPNNVLPGSTLQIGYESAGSNVLNTTYGLFEHYAGGEDNIITLAGIAFTTGTTAIEGGYPAYSFSGLSVMGTSADVIVEQLELVCSNSVTPFAITQIDGVASTNLTGVTYDVISPTLNYLSSPMTQIAPDCIFPLDGTLTVTSTASGSVTVTVSGGAYGDLTNFTIRGCVSESPFSGTEITITSGSGSREYTGLTPGTNYNAGVFHYGVVIPGGESVNHFSSPSGIIVEGMSPPGTTGSLSFDYVYGATAGTTYTFSILGEVGYTGITYSQTISIGVPVATMSKILTYAGNWGPGFTGSTAEGGTYYQPTPAVALLLQNYAGAWLDDFTTAVTGGSGTTYASTSGIIAGYSGTTCTDLTTQFQNITGFTYDSVAGNTFGYLELIPREAIASYNISNIDTKKLSEVVGNTIDAGNTGSTGPTSFEYGRALQSLFEQAVNAGMIQTAGVTLNDEPILTGFYELGPTYFVTQESGYVTLQDFYHDLAGVTAPTAIYGASFAVGQELAFYVQYNMTKNRTYNLQGLDNIVGVSGATGPVELVFGGVTFALAGLSETSSATPVVYKIVLTAV